MHRLYFFICCCATGLLGQPIKLEEEAKLLYSHMLLPISGYANAWQYGKAFNYHTIARDPIAQEYAVNGISIRYNNKEEIVALHDGKRVPLVLGSIPRSIEDLNEMRIAYNLEHDAQLHIMSLNRKFERDELGLTQALEEQQNNKLFLYPTTDFSAPDLIDLIRIVDMIKNRDHYGAALVLVHCKSGKGRSACALAAYLLSVLFEAGIEVVPKQIAHYLKLCRPQVHMNDEHMKALTNFQVELKRAGSFDMLYAWYRHKIDEREQLVDSL